MSRPHIPPPKYVNPHFILSQSHFQKVIGRTGFEMNGDGPKDHFIICSNNDISKSAPPFFPCILGTLLDYSITVESTVQ